MRIAILDDYQAVARRMADWDSLPAGTEPVFFHDHLSDAGAVRERLREFEAVVAMRERTPFPAQLFEALPKLRLLVTTGARNAAIDLDAATRVGVLVCGTDGLPSPTAELTWALILALARRIPQEDAALRAGKWQTSVGTGLEGKTLGVLGLGRLGSRVARIGKAFGMNPIAWSQNLGIEQAAQAGALRVAKDELFADSDFLSIHLVLSPRTRALVGAAELARMKPSAYLINTSRGPIVEEGALLHALTEQKIAGAALDVYDAEPLPVEHPLRRLQNVVLTPHVGYVTEENYRVFFKGVVEAIRGFLEGRPVRTLNTPLAR